MHLVYLGESGNTGASANDANQLHHVHAALVVHERQWVSMNGEYHALYRRHFGAAPGGPNLPRQVRASAVFQGAGVYRSWNPERRAQLLQDCLNILIRRETPLLVSYLDKGSQAAKTLNEGNPSARIANRLLFALNMFLDEEAMTSQPAQTHEQISEGVPVGDYALLVAGTGQSVPATLVSDFTRSEPNLAESMVIEKVCYTPAETSVGNQLANMCAYFVRRWLQSPNAPSPFFDALRDGRVLQVVYPVQ